VRFIDSSQLENVRGRGYVIGPINQPSQATVLDTIVNLLSSTFSSSTFSSSTLSRHHGGMQRSLLLFCDNNERRRRRPSVPGGN
jgi:hypothetical protein